MSFQYIGHVFHCRTCGRRFTIPWNQYDPAKPASIKCPAPGCRAVGVPDTG